MQNNTIVAETGVMTVSQDKRFLEFNLQNGYRYQENGTVYDSTNEYIRLGFTSFKKLFDLSALQKQTTNDSIYRNNFKMLSAGQINRSLDSLTRMKDTVTSRMYRTIALTLPYAALQDSSKKIIPAIQTKYNSLDSIIPDSAREQVLSSALNLANTLKYNIQNTGDELENRKKEIQHHYIEWHRKYSLSTACFVLFFIGAPLGSIIRKGGLGMPLVVAIIFFLLFHLLNMFGEKFVKESMLPPFIGMWLAVIVLTPVGIFLTYKAMHDSQLFNKEYYNRIFKKVKSLFNRSKATSIT